MKNKERVNDHGLGIFESLSCIIKDRFYFAISNGVPPSSTNVHIFSIDDALVYEKFYDDFGPFNLAQIYRYCRKVNKKLKASALSNNRIVHCTSTEITKRTNAAFLVGCYQIIYLNRLADEAYKYLLFDKYRTFIPYRWIVAQYVYASSGPSYYDLNLLDCLRAVQKAVRLGFLDFDNFDLEDYEYNEKVENGDLSWIVPNKFIAFSGPHTRTMIDNGYLMHAPEFYLPYFRKNNVTNVIRLNQKMYESNRFTRAGIAHHDLFFPDGTVPTKAITLQFLDICESAPGAIAVHCKAGLGRTGTLIGCYLMRHYHFTAPEAIAWIRICRPGSIIGQQQNWLEEQQAWCWEEGRRERREKSPSPLPSRRRKDLVDADISVNHLSRSTGKIIYINTDPLKPPTQVRDDPMLRLAALDSGGDTSQTPLSTTSSMNEGDQVEVLINSRPRVYHHKVQISGRSQSPPAYGTGGEESNDSNEPRYSLGPSKEVNGTRMGLGMAFSHSMDLSPKPSTYKTTFTQGDQLNHIKVIRMQNKQRKDSTGKDITIHPTTPHLASSYPRASLCGEAGGESGSALDFREIYNLHDEATEDGSTTAESSDVEAYNRFCYESEGSQLPSTFYHNAMSSPPNGSKDRVGILSGDSIQPSMSATSSSRTSLSSTYPRTLTPINLPPTAVAAGTPPENNIRALRARGMTTRGYENHRETEGGGIGGTRISESNVGMGPTRSGITPILPISASRVPHQNFRMSAVTRVSPQKLSTNRDGRAMISATYPEGQQSNTPSSITTPTTAAVAAAAAARKRVDFAPPPPPPPPPPPLPILLTSSRLPTSKIRNTADTFYQRLYHANNSGKNANTNTNITNNGVDEKGHYLRSYRNPRNHNNGDFAVIKYNSANTHTTNGRGNGPRGASPSPLPSPNQANRRHVRSSSLKTHAPPTPSSPVVYADIQTNSPPEFDYRPRASSRHNPWNHGYQITTTSLSTSKGYTHLHTTHIDASEN
uniref:protein-tyrosine-phosphatase n=1 Tax=Echinococcus granulosus TaxID=6210 RepID=A0A068WKH0_ECHGR|nr:dual specificity protein phosphatase CDC14A [Echinococcus granulosus]